MRARMRGRGSYVVAIELSPVADRSLDVEAGDVGDG